MAVADGEGRPEGAALGRLSLEVGVLGRPRERPLIYGTKTIEELGQELLKLTQEVACGKQTKAESLGYTEMAIARVCNFV